MTLRVAVLSKADGAGGGASQAAVQLVQGLRSRGCEVTHWASRFTRGTEAYPSSLYGKGLGTLGFIAHNGIRKIGLGELLPIELPNLLISGLPRKFDILHVHDTSSAISPLTILWLSRLLPTVMTLHDFSPFTGGCIFPMHCGRFRESCGDCPQIGSWPLNCWTDQTRLLLRVKRHLHSSGRIALVAPSKWIADLALSSGHVIRRPTVISNGVDTRVFSPPIHRNELRKALGIPANRLVVLAAANTLSDPRKGGPAVIEVLRQISDLRPLLLAVGAAGGAFEEGVSGIERLLTGYVIDRSRLAQWYGAADLHLFPSLADNQPLVILETMSCGVPTVGYATGGISEMVKSDVTGWLAETGDVRGLVTGIRRACEASRAIEWGTAARKVALESFSIDSCIDRHIEFYKALQ